MDKLDVEKRFDNFFAYLIKPTKKFFKPQCGAKFRSSRMSVCYNPVTMPDVRAEITGYSRKTEEILLSLLREQEDLKGK